MDFPPILFITLLGSGCCYSQCNYSLSGTVGDTQGNPLPGATVSISSAKGALTVAGGEFSIAGICAGTYVLTIRYLGFMEWADSVSVPGPAIHVHLETEATQLESVTVEDLHPHSGASSTEFILTGKALSKSMGKTLGEALLSIPGVTSLQTGPTVFKPVIHGLHSNRVLVLNNGIRMEGQQWGSDHAPEIDPFIAGSIAVVKDASAIKYGPDALGGVVLISPAELPSSPGIGGEVSVLGSTNGAAGTLSALLEGGLKKISELGWRVQGTLRQAGDFRAAQYNLTNTGVSESNLSGSVGFHGEVSGLELFYSHFSSELGILRGSVAGNLEDLETAMENEPPAYTSDFSYTIASPRQTARHDLVKLKGHHHLKNDQVIRFQYGFQSNRRKEFDVRRGSLTDIPAIDLRLFTHTLDGEWEHIHHGQRLGSAGFNLLFQDNENIPGTQRIPFVPNFQTVGTGLFVVEQWPAGRWIFETGGRFDIRQSEVSGRDYRNELYSNSLFFASFSGLAGARLRTGPHADFRTNVGLAWRPPNVAELYSFGVHQSVGAIEYGMALDPLDNHIRDPDSAETKPEAAVKWLNTYSVTSEKLRFELTGHFSWISHFIYLRPGGVTTTVRGAYPYYRYDQARALFAGIDAFVSHVMGRHLLIDAKLMLLRATDTEHDDYFLFIPPNQAQVAVQYQRVTLGVWKDLFVSLAVMYKAHQGRAPRTIPISQFIDAIDAGTDPLNGDPSNFDFMEPPDAYFLGSFHTGISRPMGDGLLSARLEVTNLLDTSYREYTNRMKYYADDLGRNLMLAIRYTL